MSHLMIEADPLRAGRQPETVPEGSDVLRAGRQPETVPEGSDR